MRYELEWNYPRDRRENQQRDDPDGWNVSKKVHDHRDFLRPGFRYIKEDPLRSLRNAATREWKFSILNYYFNTISFKY